MLGEGLEGPAGVGLRSWSGHGPGDTVWEVALERAASRDCHHSPCSYLCRFPSVFQSKPVTMLGGGGGGAEPIVQLMTPPSAAELIARNSRSGT